MAVVTQPIHTPVAPTIKALTGGTMVSVLSGLVRRPVNADGDHTGAHAAGSHVDRPWVDQFNLE